MSRASKRGGRGLMLGALVGVVMMGCASGPKVAPEQQLQRLKAATHAPVENRLQNQQNSELLEEVLETDVLMGMHRQDVAQKLGKGELCQYHRLCADQGFEGDDWYYDIGIGEESTVGKRPALVIGFGRFGTVERVYQLRVH